MCIRDSFNGEGNGKPKEQQVLRVGKSGSPGDQIRYGERAVGDSHVKNWLLYTSDAADERSRVDLGGRRIIKKKTKTK